MIELNVRDLHYILRRTPKVVVHTLKAYPARVFMAGGFIRSCVANEPVADIDLFVPDASMAAMAEVRLAGVSRYATQNAVTVRLKDANVPPIQIIHRWTYEKPEELIESFDFTIAKSVVWWEANKWCSSIHPDFYSDLASKRLIYTRPKRNEDAGGSLLRVLKFYQKGYRIPLDSMGAVLARLVRGVRTEALPHGYTDEEALSKVLTGLLYEVDPLLDPQHLFHLSSEADSSAVELAE